MSPENPSWDGKKNMETTSQISSGVFFLSVLKQNGNSTWRSGSPNSVSSTFQMLLRIGADWKI